MTFFTEEDYAHPNARNNGPKKRMEGGDQTDDISINDPDARLKAKHNHLNDPHEDDEIAMQLAQKSSLDK